MDALLSLLFRLFTALFYGVMAALTIFVIAIAVMPVEFVDVFGGRDLIFREEVQVLIAMLSGLMGFGYGFRYGLAGKHTLLGTALQEIGRPKARKRKTDIEYSVFQD